MNKVMRSVFNQFIPLVLVLTISCGLVYGAVQQDLRMGANDPQIQIAQDSVSILNSGSDRFLSRRDVNIAESLDVFTILYDKNGDVSRSNAVLDGSTPTIPSGVLAVAKQSGENRLTWQPQVGVRIAAVVIPYNNGYVLVGRNLREIENREDKLLAIVGGSWAIGSVMLFLVISGLQMTSEKKKSRSK